MGGMLYGAAPVEHGSQISFEGVTLGRLLRSGSGFVLRALVRAVAKGLTVCHSFGSLKLS